VVDSQKPLVENEPVLSRWSRLKREQLDQKDSISKNNKNELTHQKDSAINEGAGNNLSVPSNASTEASAPTAASNDNALPSLDDVSLEKDFTRFMQAKIPEALKRQALKTLFKDAHFNTMDGLDTYVDDYTKFEPITAEEMAGLSSWKSIMKPLEQVVTPGGYAVDVESEEGKAVLAARAQIEALPTGGGESGEAGGEGDGTTSDSGSNARTPSAAPVGAPSNLNGEGNHERYGKRVGDFKFDDAPLHVEGTVSVASIQNIHLIDDVR
jgi:Protein of unknown function (DUF3306)